MRRCALLVAVAVLAGAGAACDDFRAAAVTVDGEEVSQSTVDDDLEAFRDNDLYRESVGQSALGELSRSPGTINSAFTAQWLTIVVQDELIEQELERRGVSVTDRTREEARLQLEQSFGGEVFAAFPASFRDRFADRVAGNLALQAEGDFESVLGELLAAADVEIDPRYGRWSSEELRVLPPSRT